MSIQDDIARTLPELRAQAISLMQDTFTAYSPGGTTTDDDGFETPGWTSEYETLGRVSGRSREGDTNTHLTRIGTVDRPVVEGGLHIPLDAEVPAIGWELVCTAAGPGSDPGLVGRRYRVIDVPMKSYATARRLDVVDVTDLN